eukprot:359867-Chlamydomonas_euryale.AAC.4
MDDGVEGKWTMGSMCCPPAASSCTLSRCVLLNAGGVGCGMWRLVRTSWRCPLSASTSAWPLRLSTGGVACSAGGEVFVGEESLQTRVYFGGTRPNAHLRKQWRACTRGGVKDVRASCHILCKQT